MPTRNARNGWIFTRFGDVKIKNARYKDDKAPLMKTCTCYACKNFTRLFAPFTSHRRNSRCAFEYHPQLALLFELMRQIRLALDEDRFRNLWRNLRLIGHVECKSFSGNRFCTSFDV